MIQEYNNKPIYKAYLGENSVVLNVGGGGSVIDTPKINLQKTGVKLGKSTFTEIPDWVDWNGITDMSGMFDNCIKLTTIPQIDTINVVNMNYMFNGCSSLISIPLLDTSNVTDMGHIFNNCTKLTTIPQLDTSKVTFMNNMFDNCTNLTTIPQIDTSNVINMNYIFSYCSKLTTIPQLDTSKVTDMSCMFYGCKKLTTIPLLDASKVTNINTMFGYSNITTLTNLGGFKNLKINWNDYNSLNMLPNLTYESVMNVINNLYDFRANGDTTTTRTIKFNVNSKTLLSDADIAVATNKGWIIS